MNASKSKALIGMFHGFPSFRQTASDLRITLGTYLAVLNGFSVETVHDAALRVNKVGGEYPPSAPMFYEACSRVAAERHAEQKRLSETRAARLPRPVDALSDEDREASKARVQEMADSVRRANSFAKAAKTPTEIKEDAQSWLVENAGGHAYPPCRISAELAALIEEKRQ